MIEFNCLRCNHHVDLHGIMPDMSAEIQPKIGDVLICIRCGAPHIYIGPDHTPNMPIVYRMTMEDFMKLDIEHKNEIAKGIISIVMIPGKMSEK